MSEPQHKFLFLSATPHTQRQTYEDNVPSHYWCEQAIHADLSLMESNKQDMVHILVNNS